MELRNCEPQLVDRESCETKVRGEKLVPVEADHDEICIASRDSALYQEVTSLVRDALTLPKRSDLQTNREGIEPI